MLATWAKLPPGSGLHIWHGVGHSPNLDCPGELAALIRRFVEESVAAKTAAPAPRANARPSARKSRSPRARPGGRRSPGGAGLLPGRDAGRGARRAERELSEVVAQRGFRRAAAQEDVVDRVAVRPRRETQPASQGDRALRLLAGEGIGQVQDAEGRIDVADVAAHRQPAGIVLDPLAPDPVRPVRLGGEALGERGDLRRGEEGVVVDGDVEVEGLRRCDRDRAPAPGFPPPCGRRPRSRECRRRSRKEASSAWSSTRIGASGSAARAFRATSPMFCGRL